MSTVVYVAPGPDGERCIHTFEAGTEALRGMDADVDTGPDAVAAFRAQGFERCPPGTAPPAGTVSPDVAAWMVWQELVELPAPVLTVAPGRAVTGLPAYLRIGGPQVDRRTFGPGEALGYTITLDIASVYDVDWGDGTVEATRSQGGTYPDGDVRHRYQFVDDDNVVGVAQRWTATWTAVDAAGTTTTGAITAPLYTESALALPIDEIQAVRDF